MERERERGMGVWRGRERDMKGERGMDVRREGEKERHGCVHRERE